MKSILGSHIQGIVESKGGIHVTVYVERTPDVAGRAFQIREAVETAKDLMISSVAVEEIDEILLPFRNLLEEQKTLRGLKGNFGIFRRKGLFRIMPIPHDVEHLAVVADTFHVKPLLKWLQHHNRFVWIDLRLPQWNVMVGDNYQTRSLPTMNFKANAGPLDRYEYERSSLGTW